MSARPFLTAEWRHLLMLNYCVDEDLLRPYVPTGTEVDAFDGRVYLSLVGFLFRNTRVRGVSIPFHRDFEEVNLRFYVRRKAEDGWRRGVVFIKEIVPRWAIAGLARFAYGENYQALPMSHAVGDDAGSLRTGFTVRFGWRRGASAFDLWGTAAGDPMPLVEESVEQFITEHYWGYTRRGDGWGLEYRVEHPSWRVWQTGDAGFRGEVAQLYGDRLGRVLQNTPESAFIAEGSAVSVFPGQRIAAYSDMTPAAATR